MLSKITIKNVALIKYLEINFSGGLNILSGETGAGKSILVDSLMLLLGGKLDKTTLRHGEDSGFVEGVFENSEKIPAILEEFGFDKEDTIIVSRKFNACGKQEVRINSRLITTLTLQKITSSLVDIYGQNEYLSFVKQSYHLEIIDGFLKKSIAEQKARVASKYGELLLLQRQLKEIGDAKERAQQLDLIKYSLNEIEKAAVLEGEEDELLATRKKLGSFDKIANALKNATAALESSESLHTAKALMSQLTGYSKTYQEGFERLKAVTIEVDDIAATISDELVSLEFEPESLEKIEKRLEAIRSIKRKYGDFSEMQAYKNKCSQLLDNLENGEEKFEKLSKQKQKLLDELFIDATKLSEQRKSGAKKFEALIVKELFDLGMPKAKFVLQFTASPSKETFQKELSSTGIDKPEFYFSANEGQPLKPLIKIISGGELSRFCLALKTITSQDGEINSLIFDEIDTGISGKIGQEVAKKLASIAKNNQVLCVTHLPQIAAMAKQHFFIEKKTVDSETVTTVRLLDKAGEISEIARLSGSSGISSTALQTAKELKEWAKHYG